MTIDFFLVFIFLHAFFKSSTYLTTIYCNLLRPAPLLPPTPTTSCDSVQSKCTMNPLCPPMTTGLVNLSGCSSNQPKIQKFAAINHMSATSTCRWFVIFWRSYFTASVLTASQPVFWNVHVLLEPPLPRSINLKWALNLQHFNWSLSLLASLPVTVSISIFYSVINPTNTVYPLLRTRVQFVKDWTV